MNEPKTEISRRRFLRQGAAALGVGVVGNSIAVPAAHAAGADDFGPLQSPDSNGLRLPAGFTSRVVAQSGVLVGTTGHTWHGAPDGGATFSTEDGGWIYVSNAEAFPGASGVGAIRFASNGAIVDAYSILTGTFRNCAGGVTPWNTWLSCEEISFGRVYECDPFTPGSEGTVLPALGVFNHEAAVVDPVNEQLYLSEDRSDSLLYRFTPTNYPDLSTGTLEAAEILDPLGEGPITPGQARELVWHIVPDPSGTVAATRAQVPAATRFNGGEGLWYEEGDVFLTTKGDDRVWRIDTSTNDIAILYDFSTATMNSLSGVDNVFASPTGDVFVAEDGGNMEIVALTPTGQVKPIVEITGVLGSEVTGPALSPDGSRLYFSSQRSPGTTYEVTGPFLGAAPVPALGALGQVALLAAAGLAGLRAIRRQHDSASAIREDRLDR